jgi:hypothetical protein
MRLDEKTQSSRLLWLLPPQGHLDRFRSLD